MHDRTLVVGDIGQIVSLDDALQTPGESVATPPAIGYPPDTALPNTVRSGVTPKYPAAPPMPSLKPVTTSSKMSSAPAQPFLDELTTQLPEIVGKSLASARGGAEGNALCVHSVATRYAQAVDHRVRPAVVGAANLDHHLLAGERPSAAHCCHDTLFARAERPVHFDVWHVLVNDLCQLQLVLVKQAGHRPRLAHDGINLFTHRRVVAAEYGGPASLQKIDVDVAVAVSQVRALGFVDCQRKRVVEG